MFADCSVRVRWPLDAADYDALFRGLAWGEIRNTKGLFGKASGVERGLESRGSGWCLGGHARDDDEQLVYALSKLAPQPTNQRARVDPPLRELDLQLPIRYRYAYKLAYPNILPRRSIQNIYVTYCFTIYMHAQIVTNA